MVMGLILAGFFTFDPTSCGGHGPDLELWRQNRTLKIESRGSGKCTAYLLVRTWWRRGCRISCLFTHLTLT